MRWWVAVLWALVLVSLPRWPVVRRLEWTIFDLRWACSGRSTPWDERIVVVGIEPSTYRALTRHPVFWMPDYTRAARQALEGGASLVGLDVLPTYVEDAAVRDFAELALKFPDRLVVAAYRDGSEVVTPPESLVLPLGVHNLGLVNVNTEEDAIARCQASGTVPGEALGRQQWSFFASTMAARLPSHDIPAQVWLDFPLGGPRRIALEQVLQGQAPVAGWKDALVLIGSRTRLDQDLILVPERTWRPGRALSRTAFGVDYQAQVLNSLLHPPLQAVGEGWVALGVGLVVWVLGRTRANWWVLLVSLGGWWGLSLLLLQGGWLLPLTPALVGFPLSWGILLWARVRQESQLRQRLAGYVGPEILAEMLAEPGHWLRSLNQRREVTVLFSDINDFSAVSEEEAPERVAAWLNEHYREMAHIFFEHQGTVIRFIGDQFMVLFGGPKSLPHPERSALRAALAVQARLAQNKATGRQGFFDVKIGIHCGSLLLAVIGDELKRDYTAIGDEANVAARIQDLCKRVGASILVSEEIQRRVGEEFLLTDQGEWEVKGRRALLRVFSVQGERTNPPGC